MTTRLDYLRLEVAWGSTAATVSPEWTDITEWWCMDAPTSISRGAQGEQQACQPGLLSLQVLNDAGEYLPDNAGSPWHPHVRTDVPIRITYRDPALPGTLVSAETASLEGGTTGSWLTSYLGASAPVTLASSTAQAWDGARSLLITWPTSGGSVGAVASAQTVIRRAYRATVRVWIPAGSPAVRFGDAFGQTPIATSTLTGAWETLTVSWTATDGRVYLAVKPSGASTAGQSVYVDGLQVDEAAAAATWSTAAAPVRPRFTGYVQSWPAIWSASSLSGRVLVTAADRLKRLGASAALRSLVEEEILYDSPSAYWPLGEGDGASSAGNISGSATVRRLSQVQYGTGGTVTFGSGTGPGADGLSAPILTPVDASNGKTLRSISSAPLNALDLGGSILTYSVTVAAFVATTTASRTVLRVSAPLNITLDVTLDGTGKPSVQIASPLEGLTLSAASTVSISDGATHLVAVSWDHATLTVRLIIDGVQKASVSLSGTGLDSPVAPPWDTVEVGRDGALYAGTVAHVAVWPSALTAARLAELYTAGMTGCSGESSDTRIARYARLAGVDPSQVSLDVGASTSIAHIDSTGMAPLALMQRVADTEGGPLLVDRDGILVLHSRTRRYAAPVDAALPLEYCTPPDAGWSLEHDDSGQVNYASSTASGSPAVRVIDQASIDEHGIYRRDLDLVTTDPDEALAAAQWLVSRHAEPQTRPVGLTIDLLTIGDDLIEAALGLDVSSRVQITDLPAQVSATPFDLFLEGYTETISGTGWTLAPATTPADGGTVWTLDDDVLSVLDDTTTLAY
jgi:hypothetical protein